MVRPTSLEAISSEPSPDMAWTGLPIAFAQSFAHRSPQRLSVTWAPSITESNAANAVARGVRSEEHTSELQSRLHLVCRLLLEKKKKRIQVQEDGADAQRKVLTVLRS